VGAEHLTEQRRLERAQLRMRRCRLLDRAMGLGQRDAVRGAVGLGEEAVLAEQLREPLDPVVEPGDAVKRPSVVRLLPFEAPAQERDHLRLAALVVQEGQDVVGEIGGPVREQSLPPRGQAVAHRGTAGPGRGHRVADDQLVGQQLAQLASDGDRAQLHGGRELGHGGVTVMQQSDDLRPGLAEQIDQRRVRRGG
jgi:hypothetical protein